MAKVSNNKHEMRKNMLLAVMMTIVVCGIMLTMYYINNRWHTAHKGEAVTKQQMSQRLAESASDTNPLIDIHSFCRSGLVLMPVRFWEPAFATPV